MLTRLYTPETIVKSDFLLKVVFWYVRFDLFVGFQSVGGAVLSRDWYVAVHERFVQKMKENPEDLSNKYEASFAYSRLVAKDVHDFFSRKGRGQMSDEEFIQQMPVIDAQIRGLEKTVDAQLLDPSKKIQHIDASPDPHSIVNALEPDTIFGGRYWMSNYLLLDFAGISFMYHLSISMAMRKPFEPEIVQKAYWVAQVFEALCQYPNAPPGAILEAQASIAIAMLFLPKDAKTCDWSRHTFAKIESAGYVSPSSMFPMSWKRVTLFLFQLY